MAKREGTPSRPDASALTGDPRASSAPQIISGIGLIDEAWGGMYRGGSYLIYGRAASGRNLLTLLFTRTGTALGERCLFISPGRPKDLMIQAASIGFNLREAYEAGLVKLMRIPPMLGLRDVGDEGIAKALHDLAGIIRDHRPERLVINDFMPFVQFRSFDRFRVAFLQFLEQIDALDTTVVFVMAEPANQQSRMVIEFMQGQTTGALHVEMTEDDTSSTQRRLVLIPNVGHIRREVVDYWDLAQIVRPDHDVVVSTLRMLEKRDGEASAAPPTGRTAADADEPPGTDEPTAPAAPRVAAIPLGRQSAPPSERRDHGGAVRPVTSRRDPESPPAPVSPRSARPAAAAAADGDEPGRPASAYDVEPDRARFRELLQHRFLRRKLSDRPFVLVAMRLDRSDEGGVNPFEFEYLQDVVTDVVEAADALFVDARQERIVVLLDDTREEDAGRFFTRLKQHLRKEAPRHADRLLHAVSAIVVPDGQPFDNAEEFLTYALDEG